MQVAVPSEAATWTPDSPDLPPPEAIDYAYAIMEINKSQTQAFSEHVRPFWLAEGCIARACARLGADARARTRARRFCALRHAALLCIFNFLQTRKPLPLGHLMDRTLPAQSCISV